MTDGEPPARAPDCKRCGAAAPEGDFYLRGLGQFALCAACRSALREWIQADTDADGAGDGDTA